MQGEEEMKDYHIRIENGHHYVDMSYNPSEIELALDELKETVEVLRIAFENMGRTISNENNSN